MTHTDFPYSMKIDVSWCVWNKSLNKTNLESDMYTTNVNVPFLDLKQILQSSDDD